MYGNVDAHLIGDLKQLTESWCFMFHSFAVLNRVGCWYSTVLRLFSCCITLVSIQRVKHSTLVWHRFVISVASQHELRLIWEISVAWICLEIDNHITLLPHLICTDINYHTHHPHFHVYQNCQQMRAG